MHKRGWSWLLIGFLITTSACKPVTEDDTNISWQTTPVVTSVTTVAQFATPFATSPPTIPPPPKPTPEPTRDSFDVWQQIGDPASGLELMVPPTWINLSGRLDLPATSNSLGLIALLLADSERTGNSLLAGKDSSTGAFVMAVVSDTPSLPNDPLAALTEMVGAEGLLTTPTAVTVGNVTGAIADVAGEWSQFLPNSNGRFRTRVLLFRRSGTVIPGVGNPPILFLFTAPQNEWDKHSRTFDKIIETIVIHNIQSGFAVRDGETNVVGSLQSQKTVNGLLAANTSDIWAIDVHDMKYATLTLEPLDGDIDLTMTLLDPSGNIVARIDNGYGGDTEVALDTLLTSNGRYLIEVSEFFRKSGRYRLTITLSDTPRFTGQGQITPGQTIQGELPTDTQHIWTFNGTAGQIVSVVLTPGKNQFDAILNIFSPDGERLVALDEGFSGDPELVNGLQLPITGEYAILISSFAGNGGMYTLSLDEGQETTQNFYDAGDIFYGDVAEEFLQAGEAHAWFFTGNAGDTAYIVVKPLSDQLDLDVWLLDPEIERLATADQFTAGESETIEYTLQQDGQHLILVRDFYGEPGGYEIMLAGMAATPTNVVGTLNYGETMSSTLQAGETAVWQFEGQLNDQIAIEVQPVNATTDLVFSLINPDGTTTLIIDQAAAGGTESTQSYTLLLPGQWRIAIREFFDEPADYTLTLQQLP